jgi:hypothetical protein
MNLLKDTLIVITACVFLALHCSAAEDPADSQYKCFSNWNLSFEYPAAWHSFPSERVKKAMASQGAPFGLELIELAIFVEPTDEAVLMLMKYKTSVAKTASEFIKERMQVYEDAKKAGDVTRVNHVVETSISGLPAVEEDVERSNGARGRTHKIIDGTTVYEISFIVNSKEHFANYSDTLEHLISSVIVIKPETLKNGEDKVE